MREIIEAGDHPGRQAGGQPHRLAFGEHRIGEHREPPNSIEQRGWEHSPVDVEPLGKRGRHSCRQLDPRQASDEWLRRLPRRMRIGFRLCHTESTLGDARFGEHILNPLA